MVKGLPEGTGIALVTPFTADQEQVDWDSLDQLLAFIQAYNHADFLVVLGTTAETPVLSMEEQKQIVQFVYERAGKKGMPLILGVGGNDTRAVREKIRFWQEEFGLPDSWVGYLSVTPYYNKPGQTGLFEHYRALVEVAERPLILYNVPGRTGTNLTPETAFHLHRRFPAQILGIKEASGDAMQILELLAYREETLYVYSGDDALNLIFFTAGAEGVISVSAHLAGKEIREMYQAVQNGDLKTARKIHQRLLPFTRLLFAEGNPVGIKCALWLQGILRTPVVRLPLVSASADLTERLREEMHRLGWKSVAQAGV